MWIPLIVSPGTTLVISCTLVNTILPGLQVQQETLQKLLGKKSHNVLIYACMYIQQNLDMVIISIVIRFFPGMLALLTLKSKILST